MSSLLALQTKEAIVFASDTSLSVQLYDKSFRVANNEKKLYNYSTFIMFASGKKHLVDMLLSILPEQPTVSQIENALISHISNYSEEYSLEIVIAMKDLSKLIFFSSTDNFIKKENKPGNYTNLFTAGYLTNEVANKFEEYYNDYSLLDSLEKTYKDLSCNEVGGFLDIYYLTNSELKTYKIKIDDIPNTTMKTIYEHLHLVHANKLVGKIILSKKLYIEDELGIVEIQSGLQTIYDQNMKPRVQLGRYPTFENPNVFKYGLKVIDGAFDIRTSESTNRGVQIDGEGIRAYNSNGVKTFEVNAQTGQVAIIGGISIKTHPDSNRGVELDGNGLRIYNDSGMLVFNADHYGNIFYRGKLDGAYGSVDDITGSIKDMDGTFKGDLSAAGGTFTGELRGVDGTFTGELKAATGTFGGVVTGSLDAVTGTFNGIVTGTISADTARLINVDVDQLRANNAVITSLSAISSDLGYITAGEIDIDSDLTIGNNLYIGSHWQDQDKAIIFGGGQGGARIDYQDDALIINAFRVSLEGRVDFTNASEVDFTGVNVIGL